MQDPFENEKDITHYMVRLSFIQEDRRLCQEKEYHDTIEEAEDHAKAIMHEDNVHMLDAGKYEITIHEAWEVSRHPDGSSEMDYNVVEIEKIRFTLMKRTSVEVYEHG